jgi:hypothetical protein
VSRRIFCALCGGDLPCTCPAHAARTQSGSRFQRTAELMVELLELGFEPRAALAKASRSTRGEPS